MRHAFGTRFIKDSQEVFAIKRILYYHTGFDISYEQSLIKEWGYEDRISLQSVDKEDKGSLIQCANDLRAEGLLIVYEPVTEEVLRSVPSLEIVSIPSIGYDNIDTKTARECGVKVTNVPGYCVEEVALHAIAMAMDLSRKITFLDRDVRNGNWNMDYAYPLNRMSGKTFGLVFFGAVPKYMVPVLKAMNLRILVYAPTKTAEYIARSGCRKAGTLEELLKESDYVSVHAPLSEATFHMFGRNEFKHMKRTAFFINTARGQVVEEAALAAALRDGTIRGAAVDVIEKEEQGETELRKLDNAIVTPHAAFLSEDSLEESRRRALRHLTDWLAEGKLPDNTIV